MKKNIIAFIVFGFSHFLVAQNIDVSAVERYFKMTDSLRNDNPLSKALGSHF